MLAEMPQVKRLLKRAWCDPVLIVSLGILLRLLVMPVAMNWDLWTNSQVAVKWLTQGVAEMYADPRVAYPPLTYGLMKTWFEIVNRSVAPGLISWLAMPELKALQDVGVFRYLFWLKLPWVVAEVLGGILLSRIVKKKWRSQILVLWMLNPVVIYTVAVFANVDAAPVLLILAAFWLWQRKRRYLSGGALGVATALKLFPVMLAPFWLFSIRSLRERFFWLVWYVLPVILGHLPVMKIAAYSQNVLGGNNLSKVFYFSVEVGLERLLIIFVMAYVFVWLRFVYNEDRSLNELWRNAMVVIGGLFILTDFHVQWALWLVSYVVGYWVAGREKGRMAVWVGMGSYFLLVLLLQASLHVGMLGPVEPTLWLLRNPVREVIGDDWGLALGIAHSVVAGSVAWIVWVSARDKLEVLEEK